MNNRISTGMMFNQSISMMMAKQSKMNHLEQQLATGKKLVSAKDDPVAAGTAVGLDRAVAELDRFARNGDVVENRLGLQENALAQAGEMMAHITELTIQANNPALSAADLKSIASELKSVRDGLLSLANSTDGTGRYLFGGTDDADAPFKLSNGVVTYNGDQTQRQVEVAPDTFVKDALPGSEIFLRIRTGDGTLDGSAAGTNTGTGVLTTFGRDPASGNWDGASYTLRFTGPDAYEVVDATNTVVKTGAFKAGEDITFEGVSMRIEGEPKAGDSFGIGAADARDIFSTLDGMINALDNAADDPTAVARQQNILQAGIRDVARASEKFIDARAAGGAQLKAIDDAGALRDANGVTLKTTLSAMRDLDYAEAIGQYQLEQISLQAAQTIFTQMQQMSLFNAIR
ncbi:MAG: flagellar hook-associated protein FlgL [Stenotrophomonas rhizophila]|jgi:flagellar hook-associated protein 3 FlgL|uniref:Flagellar hook-associated protein 3 FlgL n=1 Tax=Stenotrophomonas rhizophila TaxID=216778 RepID=A0AAP5AH56_9GAMM|nr:MULTISPECIES: flagellar hook-associated protein FlgL [Stenotrophomonas]HBZ47239.1 flagellar hook-associated protein 3 [Stenotrophomonas sp.]AOA72302.1 flagellar hook-associated protein FlgL [Stenotrophomonas rhizophila]MDF2816520.1 flagellar hook-associated protein FlgL [Stenotrophomonas rhizophila]MDQ1108719.1 flagellar hook-associated protein 3 FlgL [Stenotrophomonas rhizophila]MDY0981202.1 flagellar hook-associated protein FlgL [Stenotrophomonas sp. CFBP8994]